MIRQKNRRVETVRTYKGEKNKLSEAVVMTKDSKNPESTQNLDLNNQTISERESKRVAEYISGFINFRRMGVV